MWTYLYAAALENRDDFAKNMRVLMRAIPCDACRSHARTYVKAHAPPKGRGKFEYVLNFDNTVRERTGARPMNMTKAQRKVKGRSARVAGVVLASKLQRAAPQKRPEGRVPRGEVNLDTSDARRRNERGQAALKVLLKR